jgi:hypothetical protein
MAKGGLLPALRHNKRDLPNQSPTDLNYCLYHVGDEDTPQAINRAVNVILAQHDIKPRKNACIAIECVFSLPATRHPQSTRPFFEACLEWVRTALTGIMLSFDVHLDEGAPHAHALILPLLDGKLQGHIIRGGSGNIKKLQKAFMQDVGMKHGLKSVKRLTAAAKAQLFTDIIKALRATRDPIMQSVLWRVVRDDIKSNPQPHAELLGITLAPTLKRGAKSEPKPCGEVLGAKPKRKGKPKTFTGIMTSKGKGSQKREIA